MSFPEFRSALTEGVFAAFGEDAAWEGVAGVVRVRVREYDQTDRYEGVSVVAMARVAMVRKSDVALPVAGATFDLLDSEGVPTGERYAVAGEPVLSRNAVWKMPVVAA